MNNSARRYRWLLWINSIAVSSAIGLVFFRTYLTNWVAFSLLLILIVYSVATVIGIGYEFGVRGMWGRFYVFLRSLLKF